MGSSATVDSVWDFNHDGRINALDLAVVKQNLGRSLARLRPRRPAFSVATARRTATDWLAG